MGKLKTRVDLCPNCGKGEIERNPIKNALSPGQEIDCGVCGVLLVVPRNLDEPVHMPMGKGGDEEFHPIYRHGKSADTQLLV